MAIHRFKANESASSKTKPADKPKKEVSKKNEAPKKVTKKNEDKKRKAFFLFKPFIAIKTYVVNSWRELKQVHWPNRKQTWVLTLAVIFFSLLLGLLIFGLDAGFTYLFKTVIF